MVPTSHKGYSGYSLALAVMHMEAETNPFKELEPDASCPPKLKGELLSEIDLVRNTLVVTGVYTYSLATVFTTFISGLLPAEQA